MQHVCISCQQELVPMSKMKCFDCAAEAAMHPAPKEAKAKSTKTRSDADTGRKRKAQKEGQAWF